MSPRVNLIVVDRRSNPLRFTDPSGNRPCDEERGCGDTPVDEFQLKLGREYQGDCWGAKDCLGKARLWDGDGTKAINLGGQIITFPIGFRGGFSIAADGKGNVGMFVGIGGGGYLGEALNVGLSFTKTNAPSVDKLGGLSSQFGLNAGLAETVTYEKVYFKSDGQTYEGDTIGGGLTAPIPVEAHASVEYNFELVEFNIFDALINIFTTW